MAISIVCDKCGFTSDNPFAFRRYHVVYDEHQLTIIHLCNKCQDEFKELRNRAAAEFLGFDKVYDVEKDQLRV